MRFHVPQCAVGGLKCWVESTSGLNQSIVGRKMGRKKAGDPISEDENPANHDGSHGANSVVLAPVDSSSSSIRWLHRF